MICFTADSARQLVDAIRGRSRLVMCSTIWVYGTLTAVPATEAEAESSAPWGDYGSVKRPSRRCCGTKGENGFPSQVLRPGHISGPGWKIINPQANLDLGVWEALASGGTLLLPNFGLETVHHVHADDVAQAFALAVDAPTPRTNRVLQHRLRARSDAPRLRGSGGRLVRARSVDRVPAVRRVPFPDRGRATRERRTSTSRAATR